MGSEMPYILQPKEVKRTVPNESRICHPIIHFVGMQSECKRSLIWGFPNIWCNFQGFCKGSVGDMGFRVFRRPCGSFALQPQNAGGGGGVGGIPASFPSRSPPAKQPFQPTPTPSQQEVC